MMDSIASSRRKNLEGQIGLFSLLEDTEAAASIPIPKLPELSRAELMLMEKEITGIYLSGHPMADYRPSLRNTHVVPIGNLTAEESTYQDDQIVSIAGVVQAVKMKTTRNNSMMAYVTVEDESGTVELLAFSNVISQYGNYLRENDPVVITGRLSLRDEKEPQIVVNRARPITDFTENSVEVKEEKPVTIRENAKLYLRLPTEEGPLFRKIRAILNMFPGENQAVIYFEDTKLRRGTRCMLDAGMLEKLESILGKENVVVK
jgi:DNA polymerase-3 subunit alpha